MQHQISSAKPHCELAAKQPFFETLQSCVCTKVTLSHRFKSSPAILGNLAMLGVAGYMMKAGHFSKSHESSGDLNRRSQDGVVSLKHGRLAHVRSQFSLFRRSPTHKNLPLATFCTSEQKVCPCRDGTLRVLFRRPWRLFFSFTKLLRRHAEIMLEHFGKL